MKRSLGFMLRLIAMLVAVAMLAVACGNLTPDSLAYSSESDDSAPESVIRIATPRIRGLEAAIADWEREHPTARVEIVVRSIDDHHRSVLDDVGAGGTFDLVAFDAAFGPDIRERSHLFLDISDFVGAPDARSYLTARWSEGVGDDGRVIGLPLDVDSTALAVRTDLVSPSIIEQLEDATSWCDVIIAGDAFSDETEIAFLPDGNELFTTILSQNRLSFVDDDGTLIDGQSPALERAWDLTMLAIGQEPLHQDPCLTEIDAADARLGRIARNLPEQTDEWRAALSADGFAAVLAQYSDLRQLAVSAPDTTGNWTILGVPGATSASAGGIHLGISANTERPELAFDLLSYLADPIVQADAFADGSGPFPAASVLYTGDSITGYSDEFFGDAPIGTIFVDAAQRRPTTLASPNRRIAIEQFTTAVDRIQVGDETPEVAWSEVLWRIEQFLG